MPFYKPITIDPPDAGHVVSETINGLPQPFNGLPLPREYPTKVYHLADGRMRIYVNKHTDRVYTEGEDENQLSIIVEPRDYHA